LLFVLYFVAAHEINSPKRLQELKAVILFSSPILGIMGLLGAAGYLDTYFPDLSVGLVGDSLSRPNFFAEPALAIPNVIFLTIMLKYLKQRSLIIRLTTTISLILNLALLMLSVTRGFWLGMIVAFLAVVVILLKERKASLPGVIQVVIVVAVGVFLVQLLMLTWQHVDLLGASWDRLQQALTGEDVQSVDYRLSEFKAYFKSFLESPLFGQGYGSPVSFSFIQSAGFAHNEYIWVLETTGITGLALLGSFLFLALRQALAHTHSAKKIELKEGLDLTLAVTIIGYAVVSLTSPEFTNPTTVPLLASLIGISVNYRTKLGPST
jgi:putative inorganic carbon (HCO3(-)) transporter